MRILAQELRDAVLQAAIQGRLTTQNISSLTENNIKRHENFSQNMPFSIPQSWQWKKFSDLCIKISTGPFGTMLHKIDYETSGIPLINPIHMIRGNIVPSDNARVSRKKYKELIRYVLHSGDIVIARRGELGRTAIVTSKENGWLCGTGSFFVTPKNDVDNRYLRLFFLVPYVRVALLGNSIGTTMNNLNQSLLKSLPIPFPPLEEQRRIVERVNAIMAQIDEYEKIEQELVQLKANFPGDMRAAILQAAMQGKLTEQLDTDTSPLSVVKKAHEAISETLDGQRVKKKIIQNIGIADVTFDLPEKWEWIRLGDVCIIARGGSPRPIVNYITNEKNGVNWIKIGDTEKNGKYIYETSEKIKPEGMKKSRYVHEGDFLLTNSMSFGRPYILRTNGCIHDGWLVISQPISVFQQDYLYYLLSSEYAHRQFAGAASGGVVKNLNSDKVANAIFPLPPIEEQQRIVERLDELLPLCDNLM